MSKNETYEEFVEKFKQKKTTDDCYTPTVIYEAVKNWVVREYKIQNKNIVRPFYPGGDFENFTYSDNDVVIDNPPFSIMAKIKEFYIKNNVNFFLFAPHLTLFSSQKCSKDLCYIVTGNPIVYENGAKVSTSFVTNLGDFTGVKTSLALKEAIEEIQGKKAKKLKNNYPKELVTSTRLAKICNTGVDVQIRYDELFSLRNLDNQTSKTASGNRQAIFGAGFLTNNKKYQELISSLENDTGELSEREKEIVNSLFRRK